MAIEWDSVPDYRIKYVKQECPVSWRTEWKIYDVLTSGKTRWFQKIYYKFCDDECIEVIPEDEYIFRELQGTLNAPEIKQVAKRIYDHSSGGGNYVVGP